MSLLRIDLEEVMVPWGECLAVPLGPVCPSVLRELEGRDFDYAPVLHQSAALGLIARARLDELVSEGLPLTEDDPAMCRGREYEVYSHADLDRVLLKLAERAAVIVCVYGDGEWAGVYDAPHGLLTRSDLNKHPVRILVYDIIARLEIELAELVRRSFSNHFDWISCLNEDSQARVLGYWELSKLRGVDTGPVAGATLTELLRVISRDEPLRRRLGYESRKEFEDDVGRVPGVRNQAMHPVRPLITDSDSCRRLERALRVATTLSERAKALRG